MRIARTRNWGLGLCLVPTWHESNPRKPLAYAISAQVGPIVLWVTIWRRH